MTESESSEVNLNKLGGHRYRHTRNKEAHKKGRKKEWGEEE
jgi:hypothetical protein